MTDNTTLPGTGDVVEDLDTFAVSGVHAKRQVMSIAPRDLSAADSIGGLTEAAPATDTASSGLNGRLQRVAQRLTTLIGGVIGTTAPGTSASSDVLPVQGVTGGVPMSVSDQYTEYATAGASATTTMGATGAQGDYLAGVVIIPGAAGCGAVSIVDGTTSIQIFAGGATTPLPSLAPFTVPLGIAAKNASSPGWHITCGANVTAIGVGNFT